MLIKGHQIKVPLMVLLNLILVVLVYVTANSVNGVESRKLDETTTVAAAATNGTDEKCTPCGYSSPPPPLPKNPPPSPPPPSPKKTPSQYCPPPPPSSFIYITGPPGNLYPVDENFNGSGVSHHRSFTSFLSPLLIGLTLSMLAF